MAQISVAPFMKEQDHYLYIILLTSRSDRADVVEAFDAGVDDFLTKPYDRRASSTPYKCWSACR